MEIQVPRMSDANWAYVRGVCDGFYAAAKAVMEALGEVKEDWDAEQPSTE